MASQIGTLGNLTNLTIGGQTFINTIPLIGSPIILYGSTNTSANTSTFRLANGTSGYTVTSGKTLTIYAMLVNSGNGTSGPVGLLQSDNDVGFETSGSFVNPVYLAGSNNNGGLFSNSSTAGVPNGFAINFQVASGKYVGVITTGGNSAGVILYGYEA